MVVGPMLNYQLVKLPARSAGLKSHLQKRIFAFKAFDELGRAVAGHGCVPYDFPFVAGFLLKSLGTLLCRQTIDSIQPLLHGCGVEQRGRKKHRENDDNHHSDRRTLHLCHASTLFS